MILPRSDLILLVFVVFAILASHQVMSSLQETSLHERHEQWMNSFARNYKDDGEKEYRLRIFNDTLRFIENFNREGNHSYTLGLNQFADLTKEEFMTYYTGFKALQPQNATKTTFFRYESVTEVAQSIDWREKGAVTSIKNQGGCGCCWAFSAIAAVEAAYYLKTGQLISLSEQQLLDCNVNGWGCGGGWMDDAFKYILQNNGISSQANYPYNAAKGTCNSGANSVAQINGYEDVPPNNEDALLKAVMKQPVSVTIDNSGGAFHLYQGGIFDDENCGTKPTHAVTIVGFGTSEDGTDYWLIKNSWGEKWGESGYMKLKRGSADPLGYCGIAYRPSYPTVT